MIQSAMKEPTCQKDHPAEYKNNGRPTTNQISLEPNRNNLAKDKVFILLDLLRNVFNVFDGFLVSHGPGTLKLEILLRFCVKMMGLNLQKSILERS